MGRVLAAGEEPKAAAALDRHYRLQRRLYVGLGARLGVRTVYLELTGPLALPPLRRPDEGVLVRQACRRSPAGCPRFSGAVSRRP
jgi:hypothetical protein